MVVHKFRGFKVHPRSWAAFQRRYGSPIGEFFHAQALRCDGVGFDRDCLDGMISGRGPLARYQNRPTWWRSQRRAIMLSSVAEIVRDLLIFVAVMTALLIVFVVIISKMPDTNPLKRVFSALSYRLG